MAYTDNNNVITMGDKSGKKQSILEIPAQAATDKPGVLGLVSVADGGVRTPYYVWVDSSGVMRMHTSIPTNQDSDGSAVGAAASVTLQAAFANGNLITGATASGATTALRVGNATAAHKVEIYHNATDGFINAVTGDLNLNAADDVIIAPTGGNVVLTTAALDTTFPINIGADSINLTLGASGATDSYIQFDGTDLKFYDSHYGSAVTLSAIMGTILTNPTITGDVTISEGKLTWTDAANEVAGAWTFSNTTNDGIQITSGATSGNAMSITANSVTSNGAAFYIASSLTAGNFAEFYNGSANVFTVGRYGAVTIGGNAGTDAITVTAGDVQFTAGNVDMDEGKIEIDSTDDETSYVKRNHATSTAAVVEIEQTHTGSTGPALLIDQNATGNAYGIQVSHDGDYAALYIAAGAARTGDAIDVLTTNFLANRGVYVHGASTGTSGQGLIEVAATGALAGNLMRLSASTGAPAATANVAYIESTGAAAAAVDGLCLKIVETGAAQPTTYAVNIASTSNEALHVDAGQSLFDERVTITLADNTGPALNITNPDTTGNSNTLLISHWGTGNGLAIALQEADSPGIYVNSAAASTASYAKLDGVGGTAYVGAENVGMLHIVNDGALAHANASLFYIANSGIPADDSRGHCLRIVDTGNAAAGTMGYPVSITSNDATVGGVYISTNAAGAALTVAAGTASFAGVVTFSAGARAMVAETDTANPPTNANMISAFGAAATAGDGFFGIIDDANGHANEYLCWSDGTKWWYVAGTAGA